MTPELKARREAIMRVIAEYDSQNDFADKMELGRSRVSRALSDTSISHLRLLPIEAAIAKRHRGNRPGPVEAEAAQAIATIPAGYTRVLEVLIEPSASEVWDVGTEEDVALEVQESDTIFPNWYIRSEYGVSPDRIRYVRARGDSMLPTVVPGQRLVVALLPDGHTLRDGAVYVIVGPGGAQIKRLMMEPDHIHLWSDNPDRPRFRVPIEVFERDYRVVAVVLETNCKL